MVFLAPVPAYIAKAMRGLQAERMKKVVLVSYQQYTSDRYISPQSDSRVQNVTESTLGRLTVMIVQELSLIFQSWMSSGWSNSLDGRPKWAIKLLKNERMSLDKYGSSKCWNCWTKISGMYIIIDFRLNDLTSCVQLHDTYTYNGHNICYLCTLFSCRLSEVFDSIVIFAVPNHDERTHGYEMNCLSLRCCHFSPLFSVACIFLHDQYVSIPLYNSSSNTISSIWHGTRSF